MTKKLIFFVSENENDQFWHPAFNSFNANIFKKLCQITRNLKIKNFKLLI